MTSSAALFGRRLALRLAEEPSRGWARLAVVALLLSLLGGCVKSGEGDRNPGSVDVPLCTPRTAHIGKVVYSEHYFHWDPWDLHKLRHRVYLQAIDKSRGVLQFRYQIIQRRVWSGYRTFTHRLSEGRVISYRVFDGVGRIGDFLIEPVDIHIHEVTDTTLVYELRPAPGANFELPVNDEACG